MEKGTSHALQPNWRATAVASGLLYLTAAVVAHGQDAPAPPLPAGVSEALQRMVTAQQSGDLKQYADTLANPVGPVFRLHADSAAKVGAAKRNLANAIAARFGASPPDSTFAYAVDEAQLKATLQRLVSIQIDQSNPSGNNWKLQCTTTVRMPDGSTRQIPQGFIAIEYGATWKLQDLAIINHLAAEKKGAETNWAIARMFNTIANDVNAGRFNSADAPSTLAQVAYAKITGADAAPLRGRDEYLAAEKAFNAGDFAQSLALFKQSADMAYPHAAFMVGYQYSLGEGTKRDDAAAVEWFKKDVARDDPTAENFLGSMMLDGDGAPKDPAAGMKLLQLSAAQDNPSAILNIGRAYLFGLGVPKDPSTGMGWYVRAAEMGNEQAAYFVKWLGQSPGNRSFKDEAQSSAYQQIMLLRANALIAGQGHYRDDGTWHAPDINRVNALNAQADQLARDNGLE